MLMICFSTWVEFSMSEILLPTFSCPFFILYGYLLSMLMKQLRYERESISSILIYLLLQALAKNEIVHDSRGWIC